MNGPRVILAGGSGFIGAALEQRLLQTGHEVIVLSRRPRAGSVGRIEWDGRSVGPWAGLLDGAATVVNLAGRNVNCSWNKTNRKEILASRIDSVRVLADAIRQCTTPPRVWIQACATGIYGNTGDTLVDENTASGKGFLAETCRRWENEFNGAALASTRKVLLRIGVVLGHGGGMMSVLKPLAKLGLGGAAGNGRQFISWIHMQDLLSLVVWAIEREDAIGVFNAVAPSPVSNAEFMRLLRKAVHRPWSPSVPSWVLHAAALVMRTDASLALEGQRVEPRRLIEQGFVWQYTTASEATLDLVS